MTKCHKACPRTSTLHPTPRLRRVTDHARPTATEQARREPGAHFQNGVDGTRRMREGPLWRFARNPLVRSARLTGTIELRVKSIHEIGAFHGQAHQRCHFSVPSHGLLFSRHNVSRKNLFSEK